MTKLVESRCKMTDLIKKIRKNILSYTKNIQKLYFSDGIMLCEQWFGRFRRQETHFAIIWNSEYALIIPPYIVVISSIYQ